MAAKKGEPKSPQHRAAIAEGLKRSYQRRGKLRSNERAVIRAASSYVRSAERFEKINPGNAAEDEVLRQFEQAERLLRSMVQRLKRFRNVRGRREVETEPQSSLSPTC